MQFVPEAEEWARRCDRTPVGDRGPLHGMPFSIKGNFQVKGCPANVGLTQFLDRRCTEDATAVRLIKDMGGVPFCLTNTPTLCLSMQCSNQIYGATGIIYSRSLSQMTTPCGRNNTFDYVSQRFSGMIISCG